MPFGELTIDASLTIMKLVGVTKGYYCFSMQYNVLIDKFINLFIYLSTFPFYDDFAECKIIVK